MSTNDSIEATKQTLSREQETELKHPPVEVAGESVDPEKLKQDVEARGAQLTVAIVPSITQVYPELWDRFAAARKKSVGIHGNCPYRILTGMRLDFQDQC